jgi:hypothetical protein
VPILDVPGCFTQREEGAVKVDCGHGPKVRQCRIHECNRLTGHPGVGETRVETTEFVDNAGHRGADLLLVGYIARHRENLITG